MATLYDFTVKDSESKDFPLAQYQGKTVLVVNVASKCGFTNQYLGLQDLYLKYKDQGLVILGFPCNQFGAQEPGSNEDIQQFCSLNYDVTFPVLAKVEVNGSGTAPVYGFLKSAAPGVLGTEAIKWNFTKFLVNREGQVVERYSPQTKPEELAADIEKQLG